MPLTPRREHDAVREARDALVILAVALPPLTALAVMGAVVTGYDYRGWLTWMVGPPLVAALLLACLGCALLIADRLAHRFLAARPYPVHRLPLLAASVAFGALIVAGIPATWPVVIGFALVCALLVGIVLLGVAAGM